MRRFRRRPVRPMHEPYHPFHRPHHPDPPAPLPLPNNYKDHGGHPYVVDIDQATKANPNYRTTLWTGKHLQITLMSIPPGGDIGLEIHPDNDQFLRIEQGQGIVQMGKTEKKLSFRQTAFEDYAILVPAGTWHNITNIGDTPLKLYSIYAPPHHPPGTVHATKAIAEAEED